MVAEPQPTRMRSSTAPSMTGGRPACTCERGAAVDAQGNRLLVAQLEHGPAGDHALLLAAAGQVTDAAERQHLRAVLGRGDVADLLAVRAHRRLLRAHVAVGVDLQLDAAVAEDALGHHRHHVDAVVLARHDEGRRLVVGIGGARADAGEEVPARGHGRRRKDAALPFRVGEERHQLALLVDHLLRQHQGIHARQHALHIAVAVAGAGAAKPDAAEHGTGIAGDDASLAGGFCAGCGLSHGVFLPCSRRHRPPHLVPRQGVPRAPDRGSRARGGCARRSHDGWRPGWRGPSG